MGDFSAFDLTVEDGVAHLILANAAKMNALGQSFWKELPLAVSGLNSSGEVRALIISATGPLFCSGIDIAMFADASLSNVGAPQDRERLKHLILQLQNSLSCLQSCRFPVLAVVQGACLGAGLDLVSACDLRWGTKDSFYVVQEVNIGIMADLGSLQRLPALLPDAIVREMAFCGSRLSGEKALSYGFLNGLAETQEEALAAAMKAARTIAAKSPLVVAGSKRVLNYGADHSLADSLDYCATLQSAIFDPTDVMAQIAAMKTKTTHKSAPLLAVKGL